MAGLILLSAGSAEPPDEAGLHAGRLAPCPDTANCVSSDAEDPGHHVPPLALTAEPERAWIGLKAVLDEMSRTRIVEEREEYLHAEARSMLFGFVDDVEFHLRSAEGHIAVRSASRVGRFDLGANRRRVETIRKRLRDRGVVR